MSKVRFATIGTNFIVDKFLASAAKVPGFQLVAVHSRSAERAATFAKTHAALSSQGRPLLQFTDLAELVGCEEIDAVYIASPTSCHAEQAIIALTAGKHVLCEKPACSHADELEKVLAAAKASGKAFMEAMRSLKTPNFDAVRTATLNFQSPIRHFSGHFCQLSSRWSAYKRGERPNAFLPELSNGALMDLGCYAIYSVVALMGPPVTTTYTPIMLPTGVDCGGTVVLKYDEGVATLVLSKASHGWNSSEVQTDVGTVCINHLADYDRVSIRKSGGESQPIGVAGLVGHENIVHEVEAFVAMIQEGRIQDDVLTWDLALDVAKVMDQARDSAGITFPADRSRGLMFPAV